MPELSLFTLPEQLVCCVTVQCLLHKSAKRTLGVYGILLTSSSLTAILSVGVKPIKVSPQMAAYY